MEKKIKKLNIVEKCIVSKVTIGFLVRPSLSVYLPLGSVITIIYIILRLEIK